MALRVDQYLGWDELPADIQSLSDGPPHDSSYRGCLVIRWPEDSPEVRWDGGEPEDQTLGRDWSWVRRAILRAYEAGRARSA